MDSYIDFAQNNKKIFDNKNADFCDFKITFMNGVINTQV